MAGRLDRREVPARALDVEDVDGLAEHRLGLRLDARVAAAVKHEGGIAAEEARRVGPKRESSLTPAARSATARAASASAYLLSIVRVP